MAHFIETSADRYFDYIISHNVNCQDYENIKSVCKEADASLVNFVLVSVRYMAAVLSDPEMGLKSTKDRFLRTKEAHHEKS